MLFLEASVLLLGLASSTWAFHLPKVVTRTAAKSQDNTHRARPCVSMENPRHHHEGSNEDSTVTNVRNRDWRAFRASLVREYGESPSRTSWTRDRWAHEIGSVEKGCLLIANENVQGIFWQTVVLILEHDDSKGTIGLVLNRPTEQKVSAVPGLGSDIKAVFADSQVFFGGPVGLDAMTILHDVSGASGSDEVRPGVHAGGFASLTQLAKRGAVDRSRVRFEHGHAAWAPGQLREELKHGTWYVAAAAPELITAPCIRLPVPLWCQVLDLMGGQFAQVARRNGPAV